MTSTEENRDIELIVDSTLIEIAVAHYRETKISLAKAASMAGISLTEMKEFLLKKGINPRLGVEDVRELEEDYEALRNLDDTEAQ